MIIQKTQHIKLSVLEVTNNKCHGDNKYVIVGLDIFVYSPRIGLWLYISLYIFTQLNYILLVCVHAHCASLRCKLISVKISHENAWRNDSSQLTIEHVWNHKANTLN